MPTNTVISYPIPAYQNLPIMPQFYQPRRYVISDITLGETTTVTTTTDHDYVIGQQIRLIIPNSFGCFALNEKTGYIIDIPSLDQFTLNISSYNISSFISNPALNNQPQSIAIGDLNTGIISSTGRIIPTTNIPGSFINISP